MTFPCCIPDKRELTSKESELLDFLLEQVEGMIVSANELKIVARCGCGSCPTILFGKSFTDEPITSKDSERLLEWTGRAENGALVGIVLFVRDGLPTELEAWSVEGDDIETWPPNDAIQPG